MAPPLALVGIPNVIASLKVFARFMSFRSYGLRRCVSIVRMGIARRSTVRGRAIASKRKVREYAMVVRALADTSHPVLVQIIPTRFCNLSCAYCNEYDKVS